MSENPPRISWESASEEHFQTILKQIPDMIRGIAETRINKKAMQIVHEDGRSTINEKDMIDAFFAETPAAFKGQMKDSMDELKIDYRQYGYD